MENETSDVQPKCQGTLQLLSLLSPALMTSTTKQMRPNGMGAGGGGGGGQATGSCSNLGIQFMLIKIGLHVC